MEAGIVKSESLSFTFLKRKFLNPEKQKEKKVEAMKNKRQKTDARSITWAGSSPGRAWRTRRDRPSSPPPPP